MLHSVLPFFKRIKIISSSSYYKFNNLISMKKIIITLIIITVCILSSCSTYQKVDTFAAHKCNRK